MRASELERWQSRQGEIVNAHARVGGELRELVIPSAIPDSELTQIADHIWYMDEGSGPTIADAIGSADGTISGASWVTSTIGAGDAYLEFDGVDDITEHGYVFDGSTTDFTIAAWCVPQDQADAYIMQQDIADGVLMWTRDDPAVFDINVGGRALASGERVEPHAYDEWHLVCGRYDYSNDVRSLRAYHVTEGFIGEGSDDGDDNEPTFPQNVEFSIGNRGSDLDRPWPDGIDYLVTVENEVSDSVLDDHYNQTKELYE